MTRKYFGTDGIRGTANTPPMTAEIALKLGAAVGYYFTKGTHQHKVIIGKDTRLSGYMVEPALTAGFISMGMDVILVGPLPTPAIAMLTKSMRADIGVMISASHNPYEDNGIKIFDGDGQKLSDEAESEIESLMDQDLNAKLAKPAELGRAKRLENARGRYIEYVKNTFPKTKTLEGLKIVLDCANGAAYHVAPIIFEELGAEVIAINSKPDGFNINKNCGSTSPKTLCDKVLETKANLGIALDGDADRILMVNEKGEVIDGDQLMAIIGVHLNTNGSLNNNSVVATVMSNLGLEVYLRENGITLHRTQVGDRYVTEYMRAGSYNFGGEQSGHIILSDHSSTGDALVAALAVLAAYDGKTPFSKFATRFAAMPQILKNYRLQDWQNADELVAKAQEQATKLQTSLTGQGRVLIRKSGTEPLIRVMAEGQNQQEIENLADNIIKGLK
jgi:phosphoglucosamine mutase